MRRNGVKHENKTHKIQAYQGQEKDKED